MSLSKLFERIFWHNNTTPAINEDNLNAMSKAIDDIDDRVILLGADVLEVVPQIQNYLDQAEDLYQAMVTLSEYPPHIGENGNWYVWDIETMAYVDSGIDASITVDIADINMIGVGETPYVTNTGTDTDPIFHLYIPSAPQGATGNGIVSISKTSTSGLVDTYTITYTNGDTDTFTVTNGGGSSAANITYDNTESGLQASDTQDAIDEVVEKIDNVKDLVGTTTVSTLAANATSISFTVPTTGNNLIEFWCSDGSNYTAIDTSVSGTVTLTYEPSASARSVSCRIAAVSTS